MVASNGLLKGLFILVSFVSAASESVSATSSASAVSTAVVSTSTGSSLVSESSALTTSSLTKSFISSPIPVSSASVPSSVVPVSSVSIPRSSTSAISASVSVPISSAAIPTTKATTTSSPSTLSSISTVSISSNTFTPFPTPSQSSVPGVFPATDPNSPPSVNSPLIPDFAPAWAAAYAKAKDKISNFTLDEKVSVATGVGWMNGRCVGNIPAIEPTTGRGWPGLCLEDSPLGVRFGDFVTSFPTGINTAATFNRRLIRARGYAMGQEHKSKGVNVALGPMINMGRIAQGGRNWEGFGADPFLTGEAAYETILGMQAAGVQACAKHLINNEQEHKRTQESSDVDDRTQHEIYTHPFLKSVMAGVASMMCSYNLVNGTYACENDKVMNDIVKREYGFQGYIMSDWQATHSTISAITGLDMTMPGDVTFNSGTSYFGPNLTAYVQNGTIPESRVDDMAIRILAAWYYLQQDVPSYPKVNFDAFRPDDETTNEHVDVQDDHYKIVREIGAGSVVLLKNLNNALPLNKPRSLVLVGSDAGPGKIGPNQFSDQGGNDGVLAMGWGSGTSNFTYLITPLEAIQARARQDRTSISWILDDFNLPRAGNMAIGRSAAIVFINSDSGEEYITVDGNEGDRKNLTAWHGGDNLVNAVAAQNKNTIVVVHSVGPLIIEPWIEHPNVTAVLWAGAAGEETGNAITDVLYGDWNPSGRLPYTIAKQASDYPAQLVTGGQPADILNIPYTEGLEIDYRHFDARNITPRFEFGFGLSYTTFAYSNLKISAIHGPDNTQSGLISAWNAGKASPIGQGSSTALWLHRPAYSVTFSVTNTGSRYGGDIPQLYLHMPASSGEPPSILRGFTNIELQPGETKTAIINLSRYDLSIWDVDAQGWRRPNGTISFTVGASSRDGRLDGTIPGTRRS
ncbi:putative beta-glucosidase L [Termitomyces sp. T112]|nr:putative beta-glucosidase L [Termitomyces sp. T112]